MSFAPSRSIVPPFAGHATSIRVCLAFVATLAALLPADALAQSHDLSTYVLFATERLRANGLRVVEGNVGVNRGPLSSPRTLYAPASEVVANTVQILSTSRCARLFAGTVVGQPSLGCGPAQPFTSPIVADVAAACGFPDPPAEPACDSGARLVVQHGDTQPLAPGVYGDVLLEGGMDKPASLFLTGGEYRFCSLRAARNAEVVFEQPARVLVRDLLDLGNGSHTGPAAGSSVGPRDIQLFVQGTRAHLARNAALRGRLCAPRAALFMIHGATVDGRVVARSIRTGRAVVQLDHIVPTTTTSTSTSSTSSTSSSTSTSSTTSTSSSTSTSTSSTTSTSSSTSTSTSSTTSTSSSTSTSSTSTSTSTSSSTTTTTSSSTTTTTAPPRCGDGVVNQPSEECDDGNGATGDCCTPDCHAEPDGSACGDGNVCNGDEICRAGRCAPPSSAAEAACVSGSVVAFVTHFDDDTVALVDIATSTVRQTAATGDGPWGVAIHPRGTEVYVTNRLANAVTVLDALSGASLATIPVGRLPLGVVFDPTGALAYVATFDDNAVAVIDVASRTVLGTIGVGHGPSGLAFGPGGARLYVTNYASQSVSVIDPTRARVVATVKTQRQPLEMALDAVRGQLWVTDYDSARVSVLGTFSNTVLATLRVGQKPFGVAVDATAGRVYVTNAASDTVSILDATTCAAVAAVPVGRGPFGVGVDPSGAHVYVANSTNATVAVIDPATSSVTTNLPVGNLPVAFGQFIGTVANDCPRAAPLCDDGDPLTVDTCEPSAGCRHAVQSEAEVVRAGLAALDTTVRTASATALGGGRVAGTLSRLLGEARTELSAATTSSGAAQRKRLAHTEQRLRRVERAVAKGLRHGGIRCDPGLRMLDLARGTRQHLRALRGRPVTSIVDLPVAEAVSLPPSRLGTP